MASIIWYPSPVDLYYNKIKKSAQYPFKVPNQFHETNLRTGHDIRYLIAKGNKICDVEAIY